ncbi:MAG: transposase [Microbacterium sp. 14-71-5]|nr:MAG: transposase [Microbacterium sp. 14-71-5]
MIRVSAGMSTSRWCVKFDIPQRSWRRWQGKARAGRVGKGPWPAPVRGDEQVAAAVRRHALAHPVWGHRKVWALCRHDGVGVSEASVLRIMRAQGLLLPAAYQRERRELAKARKAAFAAPPTGPDQVWQLDFSEFETNHGGTWRIAACRDYWSKYEYGAHVAPTANMHDAVAAVELALAEYQVLRGRPLIEACERDGEGNTLPTVTLVTDNGGPFRSFTFEAFITAHPELRHVRTRVRTPGQNGSRERGFGTMKYEHLFVHEIDDALDLTAQIEAWRGEYNTVRPHEAIAWNRPREVHLGLADPTVPTFQTEQILPGS